MTSIEEYLETEYSPDREFVDGTVVERRVGEQSHSRVLGNVIFSLRDPKILVWPILRMRTTPNRCGVPDICITVQKPATEVLEEPPLICVEILSPSDEATYVLEKLEEYAAACVRYIWVIDPRRKKAFSYDGALRQITSAFATTGEPLVQLPLADVFLNL